MLKYLIGADVKKAKLFLAKIDIITTDTEQILEALNKCPLCLNSFLTSGRYNLTILMIGENIRSIMSCVYSHFRQNPSIKDLIKDMEFNLVVTPIRDFIVPIKPVLEKKRLTPCESDCDSCTLYATDRCLGCPASTRYKGVLL